MVRTRPNGTDSVKMMRMVNRHPAPYVSIHFWSREHPLGKIFLSSGTRRAVVPLGSGVWCRRIITICGPSHGLDRMSVHVTFTFVSGGVAAL